MNDEENIHPGRLAPDFTLPDQDGRNRTLSEYRGHWVFLFFYSKDETQESMIEVCSMSDHFEAFQRFGVVMLGVSPDSVASHKQFAARCNLPFKILSDSHRKVMHKYHAFAEHLVADTEEIERVSFLIDVMGNIEKDLSQREAQGHAQEALGDLTAMKRESEENFGPDRRRRNLFVKTACGIIEGV